jgi:hypothetical protein
VTGVQTCALPILKTNINGVEISGKVETKGGNWGHLFDNLASVILNNTDPIINPEQILEQITIIEKIKKAES